MSGPAVLVTGAAGLVGADTVARLARRQRVLALTHRNPEIVATGGARIETVPLGAPEASSAQVVSVPADVREPDFGLTDEQLRALDGTVAGIVHCAATTAFNAPAADYAQLNVAGTAHAVALAERWRVPLLYVSTAYVCGRRGGLIAEGDLDAAAGFGNGYEHSKFQAEQLVAAAADIEWSIVRPAIVTGAADTGAIRDYKNLYTLVKLIVEGRLRRLPGRYDSTLSLVPVDFVADVVDEVWCRLGSGEMSVRGSTFHVTGDRPITLREISDVFAEYPSFDIARFVPAASFSVEDLDPLERDYFERIGAQYTSYFDRVRTFDTTNTRQLMNRPLPATGADYLRTLLDYCLRSGYLGRPVLSVAAALAAEGVAV